MPLRYSPMYALPLTRARGASRLPWTNPPTPQACTDGTPCFIGTTSDQRM
eukprot:SAG22_NODE_21731_length_254_cov_1.000000_1_plen_49_part_01